MNDEQLNQVVSQLCLDRSGKDQYVVRYGQMRSSMFIILDGQVSVWQPIKPRALLKPLQKLRIKMLKAVERT